MASQASEFSETQHMMANLLGASSNRWTASGLEISHKFSNFTALPATHGTHHMNDASFTDTIHNTESAKLSSRFKTSTTAGL